MLGRTKKAPEFKPLTKYTVEELKQALDDTVRQDPKFQAVRFCYTNRIGKRTMKIPLIQRFRRATKNDWGAWLMLWAIFARSGHGGENPIVFIGSFVMIFTGGLLFLSD